MINVPSVQKSDFFYNLKGTISVQGGSSSQEGAAGSGGTEKLSITELAKQVAQIRKDLTKLQQSASVEKFAGVGTPQSKSIATVRSQSDLGFSDLDSNIADVSQLSGIKDGNFTINDVTFRIDTTTDTLNDVLDEINDSEANVTASFVSGENKIQIRSGGAWEQFTIDDGTSGIFTELEITEGTYGKSAPELQEFDQPGMFKSVITDIADSMQKLFSATFDSVAEEEGKNALKTIKKEIKSAFKEVFSIKDEDVLESHMGIKFDFNDGAEQVMNVDTQKLSSSMDFTSNTLVRFMMGGEADDGSRSGGLLSAIDEALTKISETLVPKLPSNDKSGQILDVSA